MKSHAEQRAPWAWLLLICAVALGSALIASSPYPGVSVDSGEYLAVADGILHGEGLTMPYVGYDEAYRVLEPGARIPMTQFPPLYPSLLALLGGVGGISLLNAARVIGAVAFALFVGLGGYLVWRGSRSLGFTFVAGGLLLAPDLVTIHAMAWSEQIMLLGLLGAILFAVRYQERPSTANLVALGACAVVASMARFAGVSVVLAGAVVVWLRQPDSLSRRIGTVAAFTLTALAPTVAWFVRNSIVTGAVSEKEATWHPPSATVLGQAAQSMGGWVVPWRVATMTAGILLVVASIGWAFARRRSLHKLKAGGVAEVCVIFGFCYAVFLVVARTIIDQNIPFDTRLLSPLQALATIALCVLVARLRRSTSRSIAVSALVVVALSSLGRGAVTAFRFSDTTVAAYSSDRWRASETLAYARRLPRSTVIVTNAPDPFWLWDDRVTQILPPRSSLYSGEANENYSGQLRDVLEATRCKRALLVFFSQPTRKPPRKVDPIVAGELRVTDPTILEDGVVFEIDEPMCRDG